MAAGQPILALAAGTEAGRVAGELGALVVDARDPEAIAGALRRLIGGELEPPSARAAARYAYPIPAERMAAVIERATRRPST